MNQAERERFYLLRQRELSGESLSPDEMKELSDYIAQIEAEEARSLHASREARDKRIAAVDRRIVQMRALVARRAALRDDLRRFQNRSNWKRGEA